MTTTTVGRGPYKNGIEKRRRLIERAIAVFAEFGFEGGSLRKISEAVGVPASAITALFGSKDGLLTAVLDHWDQQQVDETQYRGLAVVETLRTRMRYSRAHPTWVEFHTTLSGEATAHGHPAHEYFRDRFENITDQLQAALLEAAARGDVMPMAPGVARNEARMLSAMMDGLQLQWLMNRTFDMVQVFDDYLDATIERWQSPQVGAIT